MNDCSNAYACANARPCATLQVPARGLGDRVALPTCIHVIRAGWPPVRQAILGPVVGELGSDLTRRAVSPMMRSRSEEKTNPSKRTQRARGRKPPGQAFSGVPAVDMIECEY